MDAADRHNLKLRILSAAVLLPVVLGALYVGGLVAWAFVILFFCLSLFEWVRIAKQTSHFVVWTIVGVIYLSVGFVFLFFIVNMNFIGMGLVLAVCLSDTLAYFFGKYIRGPKLVPKVSPNKTWAGLLGAIIGAVIGVHSWNIWVRSNYSSDSFFELVLDSEFLPFAMVVGLLLGVSCQVGDLFVSFFKRQAAVKDAGNFIPGHGGVLDRLDSLLFAGICLFMILLFVGSNI